MRARLLLELRERRVGATGWLLGWLTLVGLYVATWPTVRAHGDAYDDILRDLPAALRSAVGSQAGSAFSTPAGYFTAELLAVTGPILAVTMGVLRGATTIASDEEDGTLEVALSQPVSRTELLVCRMCAAVTEVLGVLLVAGCALYALGLLVDLHLGLGTCLRATAMLGLLGVEGLSLALLVGAVTGRSGRSKAVAGAVGMVVFLLNLLGPSIAWLTDLVALSPFHTLVTSDPFRGAPPLVSVATLLGPSIALAAAAVAAFRRRDLRFR